MIDTCYKVEDIDKFPRSTGIYQIGFKNSNSGKIYIGSASATGGSSNAHGFRGRWRRHISSLRKNKHHSKTLLRAYKKYGECNMFFRVLEFVEPSKCLKLEQQYIEKLDTCDNGYNTIPYAKSSSNVVNMDQYKKTLDKKYIEKNYETLEKIKVLYKENKNVKEISKILGINFTTGYSMLKKLGIYEPIIRKKVYQYDLNGNFLNVWENNKECSKALGVTKATIRRVLIEGGIQAIGYFFSYDELSPEEVVEEYRKRLELGRIRRSEKQKKLMTPERISSLRLKFDPTKKCIKNIAQYDLSGNLVKIWKDSAEIEKIHGKAYKTGVVGCVRGVQKTCRGFKWNIHHEE